MKEQLENCIDFEQVVDTYGGDTDMDLTRFTGVSLPGYVYGTNGEIFFRIEEVSDDTEKLQTTITNLVEEYSSGALTTTLLKENVDFVSIQVVEA